MTPPADPSAEPAAVPPAESDGATASLAAIDWDLMARPLGETAPAGPSLRYDGTYDALNDARRSDDATLPQGVWQTDLKRADWKKVTRIAVEALQTRSKDVQIAVWLAEALIHLKGFQGAAEGLRLLTLLVSTFWDSLHPEIDEADEDALASRLAPLEWFADKAPEMLRLVPLSTVTFKAPRVFSLADWMRAQLLERQSLRNPAVLQQAARDGIANFAEIKLAVLDLPVRLREQWYLALRAAIAETGRLSRALDDRCGREAPSLGKLLEELHSIEQFYLSLFPKLQALVAKPPAPSPQLQENAMKAPDPAKVRPRSAAPDAPPLSSSSLAAALPPSAAADSDPLDGILEATSAAQGIASREEAFALLEAVAQYLLRTEPHSPVPYLIKRAVAWGEMSFGELLAQFISNRSELDRLYHFLGIEENDGNKPG